MPVISRLSPTGALVVTASKFLTVGAVSTLIEVVVFNLALATLGAGVVVAKVVASLVALVNAYVGNRQWTFKDRDPNGRGQQLTRFLVANGACTILGGVIVWVAGAMLTAGAEQRPSLVILNIANFVSILVIIVLRFLLYHTWVFRGTPERRAGESRRGRPLTVL